MATEINAKEEGWAAGTPLGTARTPHTDIPQWQVGLPLPSSPLTFWGLKGLWSKVDPPPPGAAWSPSVAPIPCSVDPIPWQGNSQLLTRLGWVGVPLGLQWGQWKVTFQLRTEGPELRAPEISAQVIGHIKASQTDMQKPTTSCA